MSEYEETEESEVAHLEGPILPGKAVDITRGRIYWTSCHDATLFPLQSLPLPLLDIIARTSYILPADMAAVRTFGELHPVGIGIGGSVGSISQIVPTTRIASAGTDEIVGSDRAREATSRAVMGRGWIGKIGCFRPFLSGELSGPVVVLAFLRWFAKSSRVLSRSSKCICKATSQAQTLPAPPAGFSVLSRRSRKECTFISSLILLNVLRRDSVQIDARWRSLVNPEICTAWEICRLLEVDLEIAGKVLTVSRRG